MRNPLVYSCVSCSHSFKSETIEYKCSKCEGILLIKTDFDKFKRITDKKDNQKSYGTFWDYKDTIPSIDEEYIITLGEGGTQCKKSQKFTEIFNLDEIYFKDEIHNPTNSFKDRTAALLVSHARSWGYNKVICASNGNQGASISAYSSLEGLECINIIPEKMDIGKKAQMIAYNSIIRNIGETVDDSIKEALSDQYNDYYQCTPELNPLTIEAQKTIAFEIWNEIGDIDEVIIPMGSGGLLVSIWKGYDELKKIGLIEKLPRFIGVQSKVSSPIVNEYNKTLAKNSEELNLETHALGILVKYPFYKDLAIKIIKETNGETIKVKENVMLTYAEELARNEAIFAEPSSALTLAALNKLIQNRKIHNSDKVVCIITGSAIKTPYVLEALSSRGKTAGMGSILSTKLKILSQISISEKKGIYGSKLKEMMGNISLAAIYQHLKELEEKDLIDRRKEGKTVFYTITNNGKKVLDALETLITLF